MEKERFKITPELEEISQEGWEITKEGEREGRAAVLIGSREEVKRQEELLETEGRTADLGSYIRLHKEITLPHSEISDEWSKKKVFEMPGEYWACGRSGDYILDYIDKDGNLAKVRLDENKIADLREQIEKIQKPLLYSRIEGELSKLGFSRRALSKDEAERKEAERLWGNLLRSQKNYREKLEKEKAEKGGKEFDF